MGWVIAGIIISGILLLVIGIPLIRQWLKESRLGTLKVSLDPYESKPKNFTQRAELEISDTKLLVYISPRKGTSLGKVNIRLVERKFCPSLSGIWKYKDADSDIVSISDFRDIIQEGQAPSHTEDRYFESDDDGVGGYNGGYFPPLYVQGGDLVWYDIYIRANDFWKGWLSFEGSIDNHRAYARIKAEVKVAKLTEANGTTKELTKKQFHKMLEAASQPIKKSGKGKS